MMREYLVALIGSVALATLPMAMAPAAIAGETGTSNMPLGYRVIAPAGFRDYCRSNPDDCVSALAPPPGDSADAGSRVPRTSVWQAAFLQVRAERGFPTGAVRVRARHEEEASNWRARLRPQQATALLSPGVDRSLDGARAASESSPWAAPPASGEAITLTQALRRRLQQVNRAENARLKPARDEDLGSGADVWGARVGKDGAVVGDCEDYVLAKRAALMAQGFPARALSIAVARNTLGQTHAVLVVATDKGDLVLDNLSFWIRPWDAVPYRWIMRQNNGDANDWRAVVTVDRVGQAPLRRSREQRF